MFSSAFWSFIIVFHFVLLKNSEQLPDQNMALNQQSGIQRMITPTINSEFKPWPRTELSGVEKLRLSALKRDQARQKLRNMSPVRGHVLNYESFVGVNGQVNEQSLYRCDHERLECPRFKRSNAANINFIHGYVLIQQSFPVPAIQ